MYVVFKKFVFGLSKILYPAFVKFPTGNDLQKVLDVYAKLGLPGCVGSMDCTHVKWMMCKKGKRFACIGKEGFPTLVFQVIVDHYRRVLHVSQHFYGATPDKVICKNDLFSLGAIHGSMQHIEYDLFNASGETYKCRGGYLITDAGYIDHIVFIDPDKHRLHRDQVIWSEWLESVRKDVECLFGILKQRWRFFRNGISYHDVNVIEAAFKTVCCLNNMILLSDQITGINTRIWEDVNWESIDPDGSDAEDVDDDIVQVDVSDTEDNDDIIAPENNVLSVKATTDPVTIFTITDPKLF